MNLRHHDDRTPRHLDIRRLFLAPEASQKLDQEDQVAIAGVGARGGTGFQVLQAAAVAAALLGAVQHRGRRAPGVRIGHEMPEARRKNRDGAAAGMFEHEQIQVGLHGDDLKPENADCGIEDKVVPAQPRMPACPADLEQHAQIIWAEDRECQGAGVLF